MKTRSAMLSVLAVVGTASASFGAFTSVQPAPGNELNHRQILNLVYGGNFLLNEGSAPQYSNGSLTFTRTGDTGAGGVLSMVSSEAGVTDDQVWSRGGATGPVTVIARAKYAGDSHTFGWIDDSKNSPAFSALVQTHNFNSPVSVVLTDNFRWALNDTTTGHIRTSRNSDNIDSSHQARDQMVTYRVTGAGITVPTFALFWEDRLGSGADYDYNDAVIEVSAVPTPGAASLGALALVGAMRRRRR